jgi:glutamyl/glutaminyl-tRNA synthetase
LTDLENCYFIHLLQIEKFTNIINNDVILEFDGKLFNSIEKHYTFIKQFSDIIENTDEYGIFEYDIFKITINKKINYVNELVNPSNLYIKNKLL